MGARVDSSRIATLVGSMYGQEDTVSGLRGNIGGRIERPIQETTVPTRSER